MPEDPNPSWTGVFSRTGKQGDLIPVPLSPTNQYYAFLSKLDLDVSTNLYDIFFEVLSKEWTDNAILSASVDFIAPSSFLPALAYHIPTVAESDLVALLGLETIDDAAEGSYYLLTLSPDINKSDVVGSLYDPDIDAIPPA